jgi:hemerythrin
MEGVMTHIDWSERFDTGIEVLDCQHRKLISMINQLRDSSLQNEQESVVSTFRGMRAYAAKHFDFEEELMQAAKYPYTLAHHQLHQRFLERLDSISRRHQRGVRVTAELSAFLAQWLTHHIGYEDQDYVNDVQRIMKESYD